MHFSYIDFRRLFADSPPDISFVRHEIQTPETTKPLVSFETRGFAYIEFGGEGEIRNYPFAFFGTKPPGLQGLQPSGARRICPSLVP